VERRVNRYANWLRQETGVQKGDRVAILARDGVEHLDSLYACGKLGAIHTALNWRLHWRELAGLVEQTTPKALLYSDDFRGVVAELEGATRDTPQAIASYLHIEGPGIPGSIAYDSALASSAETPVTCETLEQEDIACLVFTGGTTGLPKGAMISHRQICWNVLNTVIHDLTHDDVYLCVFPLFHVGGLFTYMSSQVIFGNTSILTRQFDGAQVLRLIERERVTVFAGVPTMYQIMTQAPNWESADLSSLRFCTSGGAPLPVPLVEKYAREKGVRFKQGFGMTEYGPGLFALPATDAIRKAGSIGRPNFFLDVRVVDEQNRPLGPQEVGELVLKGAQRLLRLLEQPRGQRRRRGRRGLVPHRRPGVPRRGLVLLRRRPQEGHVHLRRRERLPDRDRGRALQAPGRAHVRRRGRAPRNLGRGGQGLRRAQAGPGGDRGGAARLPAGAPGTLQGAQKRRAPARAAHLGRGQDPEA
jgi:fatty-acyl-CoA synthase